MKSIKLIVGGLLLVLIIAGVIVYFNLNRIVRRTIEVQGTKSLTVQTTVEEARLALFGGSLDLENLRIASPAGFSAAPMFELEEGGVKVSYGELRNNPVHIREITLKNPKVIIEQIGGRFNFQTLMDLPPGESDLLLIIDKLTIENATVVVRPGIAGLADISIPIPSLALENIGNAEGNRNGAAMKQVALLVITSLAQRGGELGDLPAQIRSSLQAGVNNVRKQVQSQIEGQVQEIDKTLKGMGIEGVGGEIQSELDKVLNPDRPSRDRAKEPATPKRQRTDPPTTSPARDRATPVLPRDR